MELVNGRPITNEGRLDKEIRCYDLLDKLGVEFQRIDHEAAMTMEACLEIDKVLDATICKNLLLCNRQCTAFYLLMIPGDKHFVTKELSGQIGSSRLSFACRYWLSHNFSLLLLHSNPMLLRNYSTHEYRFLLKQKLHNRTGCPSR